MTVDELREIVQREVQEHGPEEARRRLHARAAWDTELALAAARHGAEIIDAINEARTATKH